MIESSDRIPFSDRIYGKYHAPMLFSTAEKNVAVIQTVSNLNHSTVLKVWSGFGQGIVVQS